MSATPVLSCVDGSSSSFRCHSSLLQQMSSLPLPFSSCCVIIPSPYLSLVLSIKVAASCQLITLAQLFEQDPTNHITQHRDAALNFLLNTNPFNKYSSSILDLFMGGPSSCLSLFMSTSSFELFECRLLQIHGGLLFWEVWPNCFGRFFVDYFQFTHAC